jgi:hypothetical protein
MTTWAPDLPGAFFLGGCDFIDQPNNQHADGGVQEFGRPFLAPPGVAAERMALDRKAFEAVLKDPQFQAESARLRLSVDPLDDKEIEALLGRAYAAPRSIRDRAAVFAAEMN